jgi:hypothetical protein
MCLLVVGNLVELMITPLNVYRDAPFVGEHSEAILSAIADLMLTRSPCDMDDADLLRSVWFLIAVRCRRKRLFFFFFLNII